MRKMMIKAYVLFTLLFGINLSVLADDTALPGQCKAWQPKILLKDMISEDDVQKLLASGDWGQSGQTNKYWTVYSDRDNNVTYKSPNKASGVFKTLKLNDELRIAEISGNFALVYEEQKFSADFPKINMGVSCGWIPMENLLLWGTCPTNEHGIYNKALAVYNIDKRDADFGKIYGNPEQKGKGKDLQTGMNFYFIMKEDKKSGLRLLSRESSLSGFTSSVLLGWVSTSSFIVWNQRACLEPNWDPEAAESMANKNVKKVDVFKDSLLTEKTCDMPLGREYDKGNRATKYRMHPEELRYPVLGNLEKKGLYKVTAFATLDGKAHIAKVRDAKDTSVGKIRDEQLQNMSNINLIVVIDGTSSMEKFYNPTQQIIQKANEYFSKENNNVVRVGVVIYRDYPDGEGLTEYLPMTKPQDANLAEFLSKGGKYGVRSVATTSTEALYEGLEVALDASKMGYKANQSNLMFVIGDCGNHPEMDRKKFEENINKFAKKCAANKVQLSAFQVYNGTSQAYKLFRSQMNGIIRKSLDLQYNTEEVKRKYTDSRFWWDELPTGYEFMTNLKEDNCYIGSTRFAKNGEKMPLTELYNLVEENYLKFNKTVKYHKALFGKMDNETVRLMFADNTVSDRTAAAQIELDFIRKQIGEENVKWLKDNKLNTLMAFESYAPKKDAVSGHKFWREVVYISHAEFLSMMKRLQGVKKAAEKGSTDRRPYIDALKALARVMVPDFDQDQIDKLPIPKLMGLVSGLPVTSEALRGEKTIEDIGDNQVVSQEEFEGMIADFNRKYDLLDHIKDDEHYAFCITRNNQKWFWLPVEDLP